MAPKKTILLADDDPDYLFQVSFYLQKAGFRVLQAASQKEAEKILETEKPDLAIFDLIMEYEDSGFILSHKMKKTYPEVPVIIATSVAVETGIPFGLENEDDRKWIKADCYLEKGIRPDQLLNEINKLLE